MRPSSGPPRRHGGRTGFGYGSEIALRDATWSEDPARVLALVAPYLDPDVAAADVAVSPTEILAGSDLSRSA